MFPSQLNLANSNLINSKISLGRIISVYLGKTNAFDNETRN